MPYRTLALAIALGLLLGGFSLALAHGGHAAPYLDVKPTKQRIWVTARYGNGTMVKDGRIVVMDKMGNKLLEGKTGTDGKFSYEPPTFDTMIILLITPDNHRAEYILRAKKPPKKSD